MVGRMRAPTFCEGIPVAETITLAYHMRPRRDDMICAERTTTATDGSDTRRGAFGRRAYVHATLRKVTMCADFVFVDCAVLVLSAW